MMNYELITLPELNLVGERILTTAGSSDIPVLWRRIGPRLAQLDASATRYAVCFNLETPDGEPTKLEYMAAKELDSLAKLPAGMTTLVLPQRQYLRFEHHGALATYGQTIHAVLRTIREQGLDVDHSFDLERYDERFRLNESDSVLDILIPLAQD